MSKNYIVITYGAPSPTRGQTSAYYQVGSVQTHRQPTVARTAARSPEDAANVAKVPAGGYALVIAESDVLRFDRAPVAPLEARAPDGNPLTVVEERSPDERR